MRIQCLKEKFAAAVSKTEKITANNPALPVLSCLLLSARGSTLSITSTNLEIGVELKLQCKVLEEGTVAVSAAVLRSLLAAIPGTDEKITCSVSGNTFVIEAGKHTSTLVTLDHADFPSIPRLESPASFAASTEDVVLSLKSVVYATSPSSMRPEYSSIYFYKEDTEAVFVATD